MNEQAKSPTGVAFQTYCLGTGMEKCNTCQHEKNWQTLNEFSDDLRLPMQENMVSVNTNTCQITSGRWYEPVVGTKLPCNDPGFTHLDLRVPVPGPEAQYGVVCNADQLIKHGYGNKYHWEKVYNDYNVLRTNSMRARFEKIEDARALYDELRSKKLAALRNWLD